MKNNRRDLLKKGLGLMVAAAFAPALIPQAEARKKKGGDSKMTLVSPNDPTAKAVNYKHSKAAITDASLKVEKAGVAWAKQDCSNCALFKATENGQGTCMLFPNKLVKAKGWCTSWSKKG